MSSTRVLCLLLLYFSTVLSKPSSENVAVHLYNMNVLKQTLKVPVSSNLEDVLPKNGYDSVMITDQNIPNLHGYFLANLDVNQLLLEKDGIETLAPGCFEKVNSLREVTLSFNNLKTIEKGVFNNINISTLDLRSNLIEKIDSDAFNNMPYLININLGGNRIKEWNSDWFYNTPRLSRIDFRNNSLEKLPANAFSNLAGEKYYGQLKLKLSLHFSYNKLRTIGISTFNGLTEIDSLWLDHNQLESFNERILNNIAVEDLRLDGNNIKRLSGDWSKILGLPLVSIDANPFDCDFITEIKDFNKKNNKKTSTFYSEMNCRVERIQGKVQALKNRLKELNEDNDEPLPK